MKATSLATVFAIAAGVLTATIAFAGHGTRSKILLSQDRISMQNEPSRWFDVWRDFARKESFLQSLEGESVRSPCNGCPSGAQKIFGAASAKLGDLLPEDPDWKIYPKELVLDPSDQHARVVDALNTEVYNPLDNGDFAVGLSPDKLVEINNYMHKNTGCLMGEKDCLMGVKVWPGPQQ